VWFWFFPIRLPPYESLSLFTKLYSALDPSCKQSYQPFRDPPPVFKTEPKFFPFSACCANLLFSDFLSPLREIRRFEVPSSDVHAYILRLEPLLMHSSGCKILILRLLFFLDILLLTLPSGLFSEVQVFFERPSLPPSPPMSAKTADSGFPLLFF